MALDQRKYEHKHTDILRDIRPVYVRIGDWLKKPDNSTALFGLSIGSFFLFGSTIHYGDVILLVMTLYFIWLQYRDRTLPFKMPFGAKHKDKNNMGPGKKGQAEGILYLGNVQDTREEAWFTNSDARTHILYLGTTGAGKTEGLKSMVSNALSWASGFVYVDGKADTDLWSSLSSLVRRFGRDDDLLVLNYMTGNSDIRAPSNTMNPFSSGSASYLTQMLVSLMPDAEGDNAMWKERAVSLLGSLMPAMTWMRDNRDMPLSVGTIRDYLNLNNIVKLSRNEDVPEDIRVGVKGYLDTLPGYIDAAFDDNGQEKPPGPGQPPIDTTTARQQHGYLSMQFTRALQSLADEYGYIFDTQAADVDMVDVVLNRRILVVLIPALEKSGDETANLGKIVAATIKGMMGSALGSTVEGEAATVIENKPTQSGTPFMVVFDEVGYYTAQGMAVMAAQARSLGFCLIYSAQDLPALEKRVKEEARSIAANCNLKIFGKLEDPTQTKEFFEQTVGRAIVTEVSSFTMEHKDSSSYYDSRQASVQERARASYDGLKSFKEGQAVACFGPMIMELKIFYSNPGHAKAMRVTRFMALPPTDMTFFRHVPAIAKLRDRLARKNWTAARQEVAAETGSELSAVISALEKATRKSCSPVDRGIYAVAGVHTLHNPEERALSREERAEQLIKEGENLPQETREAVKELMPETAVVAPAKQIESAKPAAAQGSSNPMAFFGSTPKAAEPVSAPAQEPAAPVQVAAPEPEPEVSPLDPEAGDILREAALSMREKIFPGKKDDDQD